VILLLCYSVPVIIKGVFTLGQLVATVILLIIMGVVYDRFGVYRSSAGFVSKAIVIGKAWTISFGSMLILASFTGYPLSGSRLVLVALFVSGLAAQLTIHSSFRFLRRTLFKRKSNERALIIGTGPLSDYLYERIDKNPWVNENVVGAVTTYQASESESSEVPILGTLDEVNQLVEGKSINTVYLVIPLDGSPFIEKLYFDLLDRNVNIHWVPNIFAFNLINHNVKELAGIPVLTLSESPLTGTAAMMKSIEDRVLTLFGLILVSPVMLLTAALIKIESPGPVFFRQARTGWDGKVFRIWKFRSMRIHTTENGVVAQATKNDPRITRVGQFIRRTSIDELPQLFNVLTGEMSLVGPRPHAVEHNVEYSRKITAYLARHRIKPGLTGLAQVRGYRGETKELDQMTKRIQSDLEYINNWSLSLDIAIMLRTVFTLLGKNAY
jgi:putative colanic acid biosynthesis UDP-glucose lipid carrier transferase